MRRTWCVLSIVSMAAATPAFSQAQAPPAGTSAAFVRPEAPGRPIEVGGRRLHILCKGNTNR